MMIMSIFWEYLISVSLNMRRWLEIDNTRSEWYYFLRGQDLKHSLNEAHTTCKYGVKSKCKWRIERRSALYTLSNKLDCNILLLMKLIQ